MFAKTTSFVATNECPMVSFMAKNKFLDSPAHDMVTRASARVNGHSRDERDSMRGTLPYTTPPCELPLVILA